MDRPLPDLIDQLWREGQRAKKRRTTMLTNDGLLEETPHPSGIGGVQRIYRFGDGGLSLVNSPMLHSYPFAWEAAVLRFNDHGDFSLTYETPLANDVEVFRTEEEANAFIARAKAYFATQEGRTDER